MSEPELPLRASKTAVLLSIQAQPGARSAGIAGLHGGRLRVKLRAAAREGRANAELASAVAAAFGLAKNAVRVVAGASSRSKELALEGIELAEARRRLSELLAG